VVTEIDKDIRKCTLDSQTLMRLYKTLSSWIT